MSLVNLSNPEDIHDIETLRNEVEKILLLKDKGITHVAVATIVANRMNLDPLWIMLIAPPAGGKSLEGNTPVLMFSGEIKKAKDVVVGDILMGEDSKPRIVLNTHSGTETMYRIAQDSGDNYIVNESHILTLKNTLSKKEYKGIDKGDLVDIPIKNYLSKSSNFKKRFRGVKVGVKFKSKKISLNPYFLGLWLGDGSSYYPSITTSDTEIVRYLGSFAKRHGMKLPVDRQPDRCPNYLLTTGVRNRMIKNKIMEELRKYDLIQNKHIPFDFKTNSRSVRLKVLAGLLDSDGHLDKRQRFQFSNKSKTLSSDVLFLARSLGFSANIYKTTKTIKSIQFSGTYWLVNIIGPTHLIPTIIARKKAQPRTYKIDVMTTRIRLTKLPTGKYYGFKLSGNGRFLLGDFTVTHNTEIINTLTGLNFVFPISDITVNTFLSGQKKVGKETSLLLKVNNGILAFKDFTSILSKDRETKKTLMSQLREIFDGEFTKRTGTGDDPTWKGKIGAIAGATEIIYRHLEDMSAMGDRFVMYSIEQPGREEVSERQLENAHHMIHYREHLKACFENFINFVLNNLDDEEIHLSDETKKELFRVANFATLVRSAVMTDFKSGLIDFVPAPEMPTRVTTQLYTMASALIAVDKASYGGKQMLAHRGELTEFQKGILYKTAFDSIPRTRRDALRPLAEYQRGITSSGFASHIGLPTSSATKYLSQLNALGICERTKSGGKHGDRWKITNPKYREIICQLEKITPRDDELMATGSEDGIEEDWESVDQYSTTSLETDELGM